MVIRSLSFMSYLSWTINRIPTQNWFEANKIILQINITFLDIPDEYGNDFNTRHFSGCDWYILYFCTYIWCTCCASFYMFVESVWLLDKLYIIKGVFRRKRKYIKLFRLVHLTFDYKWYLIQITDNFTCKNICLISGYLRTTKNQ